MANNLFQQTKELLESKDWPLVTLKDGQSLQSLFSAGTYQYNCYIHIHEDTGLIVFYSMYPKKISTEVIPKLVELMALFNWNISWGNFDINPNHGGIRFKTTLRVTPAQLNGDLIDSLALGNVTTLFRYFPAIEAVSENGVEVREASNMVT